MPTPPPRRTALLAALMLAIFLGALDQAIVGTALPRIVAELDGMALYAWVFTAYMLTSTTTVPVVGKLGDLYGRRVVLLAGLGVFVAASLAAGSARTMLGLVLARAAQGVGSGFVSASAFAVIADLWAPAERGRYTGLFSGMYALASVAGPLAGGAIADSVGWRWAFYLNLPLGAASAVVLARTLPARPAHATRPSLDYLGALSLTGALVPLMLAFARGREGLALSPAAQAGCVALSAAMFALFVFAERRAREPVVPLALFGNRVFAASMATTFVSGAGLYAGGVFAPLFLQQVAGASATRAGVVLIPMTVVLVAGTIIGGQLVSRRGRYRGLVLAGLSLAAVGSVPLARVGPETSAGAIALTLAVVGLGLGLTIPPLSLAAQNAVAQRHAGVSTALSQSCRTLGGTLGVALMGEVLARAVARGAAAGLAPRAGLAGAVGAAFAVSAALLAAAAAIGLLLRDVPLRRTNEPVDDAHDEAEGAAARAAVTKGVST